MNIEVKGDKLFITIDVSKAVLAAAPLSSSGKSKLVASTGGFQAVAIGPGQMVKVGLNVTTR